MLLDITILTGLYFQLASVLNPFTALYIVYVFIGAILLRPNCSMTLTIYAILSYASFFILSDPLPIDEAVLVHFEKINQSVCEDCLPPFNFFTENIESYLQVYSSLVFGVFLIIILVAGFSVTRLKKIMEEQQTAISSLDQYKLKTEKLEAMATFAAGAAHEFSTPLSTIAVASSEIISDLNDERHDKQLIINDAMLIREQVNRCKNILSQIAADAGGHLGENSETFTVNQLIHETIAFFNLEQIQQIQFNNELGKFEVKMPFQTLRRAFRGLVKNALDASEAGSPILIKCYQDRTHIMLEIKDFGEGMDTDTFNNAIDPFYTTKSPGKGMGLGLYLAQTLASRFGGDLNIFSTKGEGSTVTMSLAKEKVIR
jgi:two-component system sensor histidine kinase RegB